MTPIITLQDVHKHFGAQPVVNGFSLTVQPGEILGMLGPSGIGKSTILRLIAGLETPDSGDIQVNSPHIGYVFQEARLLPWDTALNNVILPLRAQGMDAQTATQRARHFLHRMKLFAAENAYPHQLSGGMRQRVALARAFAISPDILLLDEPFTGLDIDLKKIMRQLLESTLKTCNAAVIHVTHDASELLAGTNRIIRLGPDIPEQNPESLSMAITA
ncbi:ATP-binding cassette domain-containing protein [Pseudodesulfovibrio sp. JC047]|uniref:ABC transporter ATP-binding protein n=1 Tax=Pseudodesulfovibrio sp. JC047 TaxID=2683199 RepID=UPI0013CFF4B8|nr:ATP-binding cassette domain-containing protein [Pseudodesulfovibrio sp. JC047]NDV18470.1 ATP-binding cassette domain-containing protein [Pseudodesulfovibrio sp. JC047]